MNTLELNALAEGILTYIKTQSDNPHEGIAILGIALCMFYETCVDHSVCSFTEFARDFHDGIVATHKDVSAVGPGTVQ